VRTGVEGTSVVVAVAAVVVVLCCGCNSSLSAVPLSPCPIECFIVEPP
jgi:hypothetical protein